MSEQGPEVHRRPSRTGMEIGLVISIVGMLLGLAFNAGIQYAHIASLDTRTTALESQYTAIEQQQTPVQVRLGNIETILRVMQTQQEKIQNSLTTESRPSH